MRKMVEGVPRSGSALLAFLVAACHAEVVVPAGGGGDGSTGSVGGHGGEAGAPQVETRSLTVLVERPLSDWGFATYPLEGVWVFASDPDGHLLSTAMSGEDGRTVLQVVDNGFVTAVTIDEPPCLEDGCADQLLSVRVVPGSQTLRLPTEARDAKKRAPMTLKLEWDPIDDAVYSVSWSCAHLSDPQNSTFYSLEQTSVEISDVVGCPGSDEIAVSVFARWGMEPEHFGYVSSLPFVPGSELSVYVPLQLATEATLLVTDPWQVSNPRQTRLLPGVGLGDCGGCWEQEWVEGGLLSTAPAPPFPELPSWTQAWPNTECAFSRIVDIRAGDEPISFEAERLAGVIALPEAEAADRTGGWKLLDGDVGDAILLSSAGWSDDDGHVSWDFLEPVGQEGAGVPALELPNDLRKVVGAPPGKLEFTLWHVDVVEASDFPTFLDLYDSDRLHRQERTFWSTSKPECQPQPESE
jgi:hypothetical protein